MTLFRNITISVLSFILMTGCSDKTDITLQKKDWSDFQEFLEDVSESSDYCTELISSPAALKIRTKSGEILNIKERCPLFEVDQNGMITRDGSPT